MLLSSGISFPSEILDYVPAFFNMWIKFQFLHYTLCNIWYVISVRSIINKILYIFRVHLIMFMLIISSSYIDNLVSFTVRYDFYKQFLFKWWQERWITFSKYYRECHCLYNYETNSFPLYLNSTTIFECSKDLFWIFHRNKKIDCLIHRYAGHITDNFFWLSEIPNFN